MFASGPMALSALWLLQANAQIDVGARVESRVGEAPILSNGASQDLFVAAVTPACSLSWRTGENELRASYFPRFFWIVPGAADPIHPLILQTFLLSDAFQPTKRSTWRTNLQAVYGEEDSVALAQLLPNQATLPNAMKIFSAAGTVGTAWRASRLTTLSFQLSALHRRPLDDQTSTPGSQSLDTQTTLSAAPTLLYTLSRRSRMELSVPVSYYNSSTNGGTTTTLLATQNSVFVRPQVPLLSATTGNYLLVQPQVAWVDELSRWHQLRLAVGVSYADIVTQTTTNQSTFPVTPILRASLNSLLLKTRSIILRSALSAEVSWYLDPVLGTAVPRAPLGARIDATMGRHWSASAYVNFTTDATWRPLSPLTSTGAVVAGNGGYPDETVLTAGVPVRYTWSQLLFVEFSGRFTVRAPHLRVPDQYFHWGETEIWATLTLSAASRLSLGPS